jgi:DNA mismatch repair protein MutL
MGRIRVLSDQEIKAIAAGEVVEGPASIIKELVENSIDAKSTDITIMYENGGLTSITVVDNGVGICQEDLSLALLPHATSKLVDVNDLYFKNNIFYGFRGEALAAIAGVSELHIISKRRECPGAYCISSLHGIISEVTATSGNDGTCISVKNLFENIPARKKYIQSEKNREKHIAYVIKGLVLAYPHITFTVYKNNAIDAIYKETSSLFLRIMQVSSYSKEYYLDIFYKDIYVDMYGLISISEHGHYDRNKIFILANNRLIKQSKITQRCIKPYYAENFIKRYPELYLHIIVPPDQIDVNVHPRKEEVVFLYHHKIEQIIEKVISEALEKRTKSILLPVKKDDSLGEMEKEKTKEHKNDGETVLPKDDLLVTQKNFSCEDAINRIEQRALHEIPSKIIFSNSNSFKEVDSIALVRKNFSPEESLIDLQDREYLINNGYTASNNEKISSHKNKFIQEKLIPKEEEHATSSFIGILDYTYILLLKEKSILCIDQHALHEKILYEEYKKKYSKERIISHILLFPEYINLNLEELAIMRSYSDLFYDIGIIYDLLDSKIIVKGIPPHFSESNDTAQFIKRYIGIIEEHVDQNKDIIKAFFIHEFAASYACKKAIKAGDKISSKEVSLLLDHTANTLEITFCPHGRPIYYEITSELLATLCKRK